MVHEVEVSARHVVCEGTACWLVLVRPVDTDMADWAAHERAMHESQGRFRAVAETASSAIVICKDELLMYANSASEQITGYSAAELSGMKFWQIVHPDFREVVRSWVTVRQNGEENLPSRYELKIVTKAGTERWLDFTAGVIEYEGGTAILGTAIDITERKLTEQELQIQKKQLEELFETAPEGIVILGFNGAVVRANQEFLRMFGFTLEEVQKHGVDKLIVPEWLNGEASELTRTLVAGNAIQIETIRCRKNGTLLDVSVLAKPIAVTAEDQGRFVIYRDITNHRRAERFREAQLATTSILSESATLEEAVGELLHSLASALGWDHARMWDVHGEARCFKFWTTAGEEVIEEIAPASLTSAIAERVARDAEPIWVADIEAAKTWPAHVVHTSKIASVFALPIRCAGTIVGVFEFLSRTLRQPDFEAVKVIADICSQIGQFVERKNAERAVVESEAKFRAVADTAASAICIISNDRLIYVNRATEIITGYTRQELQTLRPWGIVHPEDVTVLRERVALRLKGQDLAPRSEFRIMNRAAEPHWVDYSAAIVTFGGENAILVTAFDITDRKRAEQMQSALYRITALAGTTEDLNALYKGIHAIVAELMYARNFYIALLDEDRQMIEFPYFVDEIELEPPPPQQFGRGLTDYVLRTGLPLFADPEHFEELVAAGEVESVGAPSIDWLGVPLRTADKAFGILAVQSYSENIRYGIVERDILTFVSHQVARAIESRRHQDALARSEARYRSQVQSALYGLYRSSSDGKFLDVNPALVEMLGYDSAEELLNLEIARDVYLDPTERLRLIGQAGENERISGLEARWRRKDGRVITVRLSGRRGTHHAGDPQTFEMIAEDITERRQLEEQLRHSQKMEAVGRLAGGVAHDFNNLLTVIKGYSDLMLSELRHGERHRSEVEEIRRAAERAAELTRQLLAFSRKQVMEPKVIDLNSIVSTMDRLLRRLLGEDVELYVSLDPQLGAVKADPGQIEQVIMNLAVNARDAMPGGGHLTIETKNVDFDSSGSKDRNMPSPGSYAMIAVTDTGTGMDRETITHIFEPFFTTKELGKGTGLGLSTAYGIVKQSGGHVAVYSEVGRGSCFKVYLPIAAGSVIEHESRMVAPVAQAAHETILLVEDEDGVRALVKQILQKNGYVVIEARNGAEALLACEQHSGKIDLLLSDVVLAHMSGREIARQLTAKRTDLKVLFVSGYTEEAIMHNGVLEPGTAFLQKPFTPAALARKIREVLDTGVARALSGRSS